MFVDWFVLYFSFFTRQMRRFLLLCEYISSLIKYCTKYGQFWRVHLGPTVVQCSLDTTGVFPFYGRAGFPNQFLSLHGCGFKFHKYFLSFSKCKVESKHLSRLPYLQRQKFKLEATYLLIRHAFVFELSSDVICICGAVNSFVWFSKYFVGTMLRKNICMTFKVIFFGVILACCVNILHT